MLAAAVRLLLALLRASGFSLNGNRLPEAKAKAGWRRTRQWVHPPKPTVGVRASRPNQIWHIDTTAIKLIDGTKVYLQAVVDNSRGRCSLEPAPRCWEEFALASINAKTTRIAANRAMSCQRCLGQHVSLPEPQIPLWFQLRRDCEHEVRNVRDCNSADLDTLGLRRRPASTPRSLGQRSVRRLPS